MCKHALAPCQAAAGQINILLFYKLDVRVVKHTHRSLRACPSSPGKIATDNEQGSKSMRKYINVVNSESMDKTEYKFV